MIPGGAVAASRTDPALLRALARGHQWFGDLASGRAVSTKQIADREGLSDSYVRHMVPLGLLAPEIVESICAGRQSVSLSAERLKDHAQSPDRMGCAAATAFGLEHFRHAGRQDHRFPHRFVVAPNSIATETNRGESALCAAVGRSPLPRPRLNRAPRADFIASPKSRETCQTVWRMTQSDANRSPASTG